MKIRVVLSGIEPIEDLKKTGKCVVAGSLDTVFLKEGTAVNLVFGEWAAEAIFVKFTKESHRNGLYDLICEGLPVPKPAGASKE